MTLGKSLHTDWDKQTSVFGKMLVAQLAQLAPPPLLLPIKLLKVNDGDNFSSDTNHATSPIFVINEKHGQTAKLPRFGTPITI